MSPSACSQCHGGHHVALCSNNRPTDLSASPGGAAQHIASHVPHFSCALFLTYAHVYAKCMNARLPLVCPHTCILLCASCFLVPIAPTQMPCSPSWILFVMQGRDAAAGAHPCEIHSQVSVLFGVALARDVTTHKAEEENEDASTMFRDSCALHQVLSYILPVKSILRQEMHLRALS